MFCWLTGEVDENGSCRVCTGRVKQFGHVSFKLLPPIILPNMPVEIIMNYALTSVHMINHLPLDELSLSNDFVAQIFLDGIKSKDENVKNQVV
jgi:hypothetical protein